jgi:Ala-tRNA(Pro) deacylase
MFVQRYLRENGIKFEEIPHAHTFLSWRVASAAHAPVRQFAKTVVLDVDSQPWIAVIPSDSYVDLRKVKRLLKAKHVHLATEERCHELFPECEVGAWPPLGTMHRLPAILDDGLMNYSQLTFESDDHTHAIRMSTLDYEVLEQPKHARVARQKGIYRENQEDVFFWSPS